ncbi:MAG TPA: S1 RNA-binding domain-containing protein [Pirellulales bacterium]|nr:S1 RNA-binding domain-containing protein [Pirellulales bacterium]
MVTALETTTAAAPATDTPVVEPQAPESQATAQPELAPKPMQLTPGKTVRKLERPLRPEEKVAVPNLRAELPPELADELEASLGGMSIDELIESEPKSSATAEQLEPESRVRGKVIHVHRDSVFVDLGGPNQGVLPSRQFATPPEVGTVVEGVVVRFNAEESLYELSVVGGAVDVGDWSQVAEGMIVEARITGHNKGGLECDVSKLRGFIPMSQIAPYRVEHPEQFVGQAMVCLVTEVDPERRKLVLSRRSMIEREQAEAKEKMLAELAPGQIREGIVRSLRDFGAFVDIGGVDGLLHVSQISWDRIKHPNEVLKEGQKIRVKIDKINPETHKISLSYRDLMENPWKTAASKYAVTSIVRGTVSKLMDFGAFVRLEAGVEGLIHISELAHQRVFRASDIVSEGQEVEVKVLSVDPDAQRISLSLKALQARPEPKKKAEPEQEEAPPLPSPSKRSVPLKGGLGRGTGGAFGLKW